MVRKTGSALVVFFSVCVSTAYAGSLGETRIGVELLQLERDSNQDVVYLWDNNGTVAHADDSTVGTTGRFDDAADAGYRLSAARRLSPKWSIQGAYSTSGELSETQSFSDPSSQLTIFWDGSAFPNDEFDSADTVDASYTSELDNVELNIVYAVSERVDVFGGIVQMNLDENFLMVSDDFGAVGGIGRYSIDTSNELLGVQAGVHLNYPATERLAVYLQAKLGWYNNDATQSQVVTEPVTNRNVSVSGDTTASAYEVRLGGSYDFGNNILVNLGYQYTRLTDVALAESQFDVVTGGTTLSIDDEITWQGFHLGLNYYF